MEALKAQAIAGRTYALYKAKVYRNLDGNSGADECLRLSSLCLHPRSGLHRLGQRGRGD